MHPILFQIGPVPIYSYGFMIALAFIASSVVLKSELRRRKLETALTEPLLTSALLGGIFGARLFFIFQNFNEFSAEPWSMIFSGGGLVWYGGFIGGILAVAFIVYRKRLDFLHILDSLSPPLALGYAIGRIGCLLAGDGDYGKPTDLPWAMSFPNGIVPTYDPVHPTPLYETFIMLAVFILLRHISLRNPAKGKVFAVYLIVSSLERFLIEFVRINPVIFFYMTLAQFISIPVLLAGMVIFLKRYGSLSAKKKIAHTGARR